MYSSSAEQKKSPVIAILIQEHNLKNSQDSDLRLYARRRHRLLWLARYKPPNEERNKGHGTAIIIPIDSIERKVNESVDEAIERITKSLKGSKCGRVTTIQLMINGRPIKITSAYAPAQSHLRPAFFTNTLAPHLSKHSIIGIDANCVPDVLLDTQRPMTNSDYDNKGANELNALLSSLELSDIAREQLGSRKLFTAHHTNSHGHITRTRIDQIYTPNINSLLWTHTTNHTFLPHRLTLPGPPDHTGLELNLEIAHGEPG